METRHTATQPPSHPAKGKAGPSSPPIFGQSVRHSTHVLFVQCLMPGLPQVLLTTHARRPLKSFQSSLFCARPVLVNPWGNNPFFMGVGNTQYTSHKWSNSERQA